MSRADPAVPGDAPRDDGLPIAALRHRVVAHVRRRLAGVCGVAPGSIILAGVSGGPDSMALLLALAAVSRRARRSGWSIRLHVGHVNHHLRAGADADAAAVRELCDRLGVPCEVLHVHPGSLEGSLGANARRLRYDALAGAAQRAGAIAVATAHHAEDQLETMIMALCRGAGLDGLKGMRWRRPLRVGIDLVRPMLDLSKRDAEQLCEAAGVTWRIDPGNDDPTTVRGRLRREVIPVLESMWPGAAPRAAGTAESLSAALEALESTISAMDPTRGEWSRRDLASQADGVIRLFLRRAAVAAQPACGDRIGRRHLDDAVRLVRRNSPGQLDWPLGLRLVVRRDVVRLERP